MLLWHLGPADGSSGCEAALTTDLVGVGRHPAGLHGEGTDTATIGGTWLCGEGCGGREDESEGEKKLGHDVRSLAEADDGRVVGINVLSLSP